MSFPSGLPTRNSYRSVCLFVILGGWVALLVCLPSAGAAEPGVSKRRSPEKIAFKTERDSKVGDWGRYDRTTESLGKVQRLSVVTETLANDGKQLGGRATMTRAGSDEKVSEEFTYSIGNTIEDTLFSDIRLSGKEKIRKNAFGRETLVVAGHAFDCIILSATASAGGVQTDVRVWYSPEAPFLGMVRKETVSRAMRGKKELMSVTYRMELVEWGDASRPPTPDGPVYLE